jgi:SAM-dependent methyltransferase
MTTVLTCPPEPTTAPLSQRPSADLSAAKAKQKVAWTAGDYAVVGTTLQIVGETLCEAVDLRAHERVLDVAAGNGNAALAAARRFAHVTAVDYVPALLRQAQVRAEAERLPLEVREGDAENLAFDDGSFDVVLSTFGVMFTPDQERAARELLRVCRSGGRIGLANWTPEGFIGRLFKLIGRRVPPAAGVRPPSAWGTEARIEELFGPGAARIRATRRQFVFRYASPAHWIDVFRTYYGPVHKAFAALDAEGQAALEAELTDLLRSLDVSAGSSLVIPSEYLEVVIERA